MGNIGKKIYSDPIYREKLSKAVTLKRIQIKKECLKCHATFEVTRRITRDGREVIDGYEKRFCSRKCANGRQHTREWNRKIKTGINTFFSNKGYPYTRRKNITSILELSRRSIIRVIKQYDLKCSLCGWDKHFGHFHHIKGKKVKGCNEHSNLSYVCPNCHTLIHAHKIMETEVIPLSAQLPENWFNSYLER